MTPGSCCHPRHTVGGHPSGCNHSGGEMVGLVWRSRFWWNCKNILTPWEISLEETGAVVSLDIEGCAWTDVWRQISTKLFAVHLRHLAGPRAGATQGSAGIPMGPELPSHQGKGYPRAGEGNGLTWLLPAAIWCLDDHVQLPQIKAVPRPQTARGYTGTGQRIKGVRPTDAPTVLCHSHSASASVLCTFGYNKGVHCSAVLLRLKKCWLTFFPPPNLFQFYILTCLWK